MRFGTEDDEDMEFYDRYVKNDDMPGRSGCGYQR